MAWYHDDWQYRVPLTWPNNGGSSEVDGTLTIPKAMGKFWDNVQADFDDIRITGADGLSLLSYQFVGTPSVANKTCTFNVKGYDISAHVSQASAVYGSSVGSFMYWGNSGASAVADSQTTSNELALRVEISAPGDAASPIIKCGLSAPDAVYPTHRIRKQVDDVIHVWWDLRACMATLARPSNKSNRNEEIAYVQFSIVASTEVDPLTANMYVTNNTSIAENYMIKTEILAGNPTYSPNKGIYLLKIVVGLFDEARSLRVLDQRATLIVDNLIAHTS